VIYSVYDEMDHPAIKALVKAVTEPISDRVMAKATTNFEALCADKPLTVSNAFFDESRAGRS